MYELLDEWESRVGNFLIFDFEFWILENQNPDFCFGDECAEVKRLDSATLIYRTGAMCHYLHLNTLVLYHFTTLK